MTNPTAGEPRLSQWRYGILHEPHQFLAAKCKTLSTPGNCTISQAP
jgi:hypothetical protein